jgi:hypothetical protein
VHAYVQYVDGPVVVAAIVQVPVRGCPYQQEVPGGGLWLVRSGEQSSQSFSPLHCFADVVVISSTTANCTAATEPLCHPSLWLQLWFFIWPGTAEQPTTKSEAHGV